MASVALTDSIDPATVNPQPWGDEGQQPLPLQMELDLSSAAAPPDLIAVPDYAPVEAREEPVEEEEALDLAQPAEEPPDEAEPDVEAVLMDRLQREVEELRQEVYATHVLLDAAGAQGQGLSLFNRTIVIAERWLCVAKLNHTESCSCHMCMAARMLLRTAHEL